MYEEICDFLRANAGCGYDAVNLHGGEATVHPRFLETLALIKSLGYPEVHLQTNGILLAKLPFAERMVGLGVRLFIISLHGDSATIQDPQTSTPGGFQRTVQGIRNVKALGARVRTNTVITLQNLERLYGLSELAVSLGVDHLNFSNLHPVGSAHFGLSRMLPTFADVRRHLYPAIDHAQGSGRRVTLEGFPHCVVSERAELRLDKDYREIRMLYRGRVIENYDLFMNDVMRIYGEPCVDCGARDECGGVYTQYIELRGWKEFAAVKSPQSEVPEALAPG